MSGQVFGEGFAIIPETVLYSTVSANAVRLYGVFARHADQEGRSYPGLKRLTELLGVSEDTVRRAKKELVDQGYITVKERFDEDGRRTTDDVFLPGAGRTGATYHGRVGATPRSKAIKNEKTTYVGNRKNGTPDPWVPPPAIVNLKDLPEKNVDPAPSTFAAATIARLRQRNVDG